MNHVALRIPNEDPSLQWTIAQHMISIDRNMGSLSCDQNEVHFRATMETMMEVVTKGTLAYR
jgi:hypothetical protein